MSLKRLASDRPHEETDQDNREFKRQKTLPRWVQKRPVIEEFLDRLSSASESVANLNKCESGANLDQINMDRLQTALAELRVLSDDKTLDVKLHDIDSYLARKQAACVGYIEYLENENPMLHRLMKRSLNDIIWLIKSAREQLPGTLCYWMNRCGNAEWYYPRH